MSVSSTTQVADSSPSTTGAKIISSSNASSSTNLDQQDFLKLLVTQLSNQDPLNPTDDKDFLASMAQFSATQGVQTMTNYVSQLQGSGLIGKTITATIVENGATSTVTGVVKSATYKTNETTVNADGTKSTTTSNVVHLDVGGHDVTLDEITKVA